MPSFRPDTQPDQASVATCSPLLLAPAWRLGQVVLAVMLALLSFGLMAAYRYHNRSGWAQQEALVRERLGDPDHAEFRRVILSRYEPHTYCGEVNAYLSEDAMSGFARYIVHLSPRDEADTLSAHPQLAQLVGGSGLRIESSPLSPDGESDSVLFSQAWQHYC